MSINAISHSMADAYMACQKRFEYAHVKKLMPMTTPEALARGTYCHHLMEIFFTCIKEGQTPEHAKAVTLLNATDDMKYFNKMWNRIEHFFDNIYPTLGWVEIISIEQTYRLPVGGRYEFPFTVDLVVRITDGTVVAIDFKFGADDYDEQMLSIYPQLPKYVGGLMVLKEAGMLDHEAPTKAMYVFIRSRANMADPKKFVTVSPVSTSQARVRNSFMEQDRAAQAIQRHLATDNPFPRTFNNNCKFCPFIDLCSAEMNGRSPEEIETMEKVLYTTNTYGYEVEEIA